MQSNKSTIYGFDVHKLTKKQNGCQTVKTVNLFVNPCCLQNHLDSRYFRASVGTFPVGT